MSTSKRKFHINDKGKAAPCDAKLKCRFGGESGVENHFDNEKDALKAEEKLAAESNKSYSSLNKNSLHSVPGYRSSEITALNNIMDVNLLNNMIKQRYVITSAHPDDPNFKILTYSSNAQYDAKWNDVTIQTRGLIIHAEKDDLSDAVVLERPWKKFFTLQQHDSGWSLGDEDDGAGDTSDALSKIDFDAPAHVTDKMDGSLGILYRAPDGKLALSTKGSFKSDQAYKYTEMLRNDPELYKQAEKLREDNPNNTYLFELTGEENQIVLEYDEDEITLLGAVDRVSGKYHNPNDYENTWPKVTETMNANNLREALQLPDRPNREGVVVNILTDKPENQMQIKIKQEDYLAMHRLASGVSNSDIKTTIRSIKITPQQLINISQRKESVENIKEVHELLHKLKEGKSQLHHKLYESNINKIDSVFMGKAKEFNDAYELVRSLTEESFKDGNQSRANFFKNMTDSGKSPFFKSQAMNMYSNRFNGKDILENLETSKIMSNIANDVKETKKEE